MHPMTMIAAPEGPPYSYPSPLPEETKQAHLAAARTCQRRVNYWNGLVFFPGIVLVIVSLFWGRGRSSDPSDLSLWESSPQVAMILLLVGIAAIVAGVIPIIMYAPRKGKHTRMLKAYGVRLNKLETQELAEPRSAS